MSLIYVPDITFSQVNLLFLLPSINLKGPGFCSQVSGYVVLFFTLTLSDNDKVAMMMTMFKRRAEQDHDREWFPLVREY